MQLLLIYLVTVMNVTLTVKSPAFNDNGVIPSQYTCDGDNINPELNINNYPTQAKSFAIIVDDPDAPNGTVVHWLMWNIPPTDNIPENSTPGVQGKNTRNENRYMGPCPSSGSHHYHFRIYVLDTQLDLQENTDKQALLNAMEGHILVTAELVGLYKRAY
jgi:Raf kinase inhibitor-like YbhB/YbcL family protein